MAVSIHGNNGLVTTNGTAAAPSLAAPDTDTGLYFGTNLIHATTNGVNRFNIDSGGNIGIAVTTPSTKLSLEGSAGSTSHGILIGPKHSGGIRGVVEVHSASDTIGFNLSRIGGGSDTDIVLLRNVSESGVIEARNSSNTSKVYLNTNGLSYLTGGHVIIGGTSWGAAGSMSIASYGGFRSVLASGQAQDTMIGAISGASNGFQINTDGSNNQTYTFHNGSVVALRIDSNSAIRNVTAARGDFYNGSYDAKGLHLEGVSGNRRGWISLVNNSNNSGESVLMFGKTRGTSAGAVTIVAANDDLGVMHFSGADGVDLRRAAEIRAQVEGTPAVNKVGGRLMFYTTANTTDANPTEKVRITSNGCLNIGSGQLDQTDRLLNVYGGRIRISGLPNNSNSLEIYASATTGQSHGIMCQAGTNASDINSTFRNTSGTTLFRVRGDGNIGVGVDAPARKLHIKNSGIIKLENTSTGGWLGLEFLGSSGTNNYDGYMGLQDSDGLFFLDNNSNGHDFAITQAGQLRFPQNGAEVCWGASQQFRISWDNGEERAYLTGVGAYGLAIRVNGGNRLEINKTTGDVTMQGASGRNFNWDNSEASLYLTDSGSGASARLKVGSGGDLQLYHDVGSHLNHITCASNADLKVSTKTLQVYEYSGVTKKFEVTNRGKVLGYHQDTSAYGASDWARTGSGNQSNSSQAHPEGSFQFQSNTGQGLMRYKSFIQSTNANQTDMYITLANSGFYRITVKASHNSQVADVGMWLVYGLNNISAKVLSVGSTGGFTVSTQNTHVNSHDTTLKINYNSSLNQGMRALVEVIGGF